MSTVQQSLRLVYRQALQAPTWTLAVTLTIALAIGLTTAAYSLLHVVLLRSLPYEAPEQLVMLHDQYLGLGYDRLGMSEPELYDYRRLSRRFETLAPFKTGETRVKLGDETFVMEVALITNDLFEVLGPPTLGRTFLPEEQTSQAEPAAVVVSWRFFIQHLSGDATEVGKTSVNLADRDCIVVGVMPNGFLLPSDLARGEPTDFLLPLQLHPSEPDRRSNPNLNVVGRLLPEVSITDGRQEKIEILAHLQREYPQEYSPDAGFNIILVPLLDAVVGDSRRPLHLLLIAAILVFLISVGNLINLVLARWEARRGEFSIRAALGASRLQALRQVGAEAIILTLLGGIPGLLLGHLSAKFFAGRNAGHLPRLKSFDLHFDTVGVWIGLIALVSILIVCIVMFQVSRLKDLQKCLREETLSTTAPRSRSWLRKLLVISQIGFSIALLTGTGLLARSYHNLSHADFGFKVDNILITDLSLPSEQYSSGNSAANFYERLLDRVRQLPSVESAAIVGWVPLESRSEVWPVVVEGMPHGNQAPIPTPEVQVVSSGYLQSLGIELVIGSDFPDTLDAQSNQIVLINEAMARDYLPEGDPIGRRVKPRLTEDAPWMVIGGVVRNTRDTGIREPIRPKIFYHHTQIPAITSGVAFRQGKLLLDASSTDSGRLFQSIRAEIRTLDKGIPVQATRTMQEIVSRTNAPLNFTLRLLAAFASLATTLTMVGVYGLLSEFVGRRKQELAIRQVLGASRFDASFQILKEGLRIIAAGTIVGGILSLSCAGLISHLIYGVESLRWPALLITSTLVAVLGALASFLPAQRAGGISLATEIRKS